jgi:thiamine-phosphate pyrophosphorylase
MAILDWEWLRGRPLESVACGIIQGGATVLQYRDKVSETAQLFRNAEILRRLTGAGRVPLIINDRLDIALAVGADGVHAGQNDLPLAVIRSLAPRMTVGISVSALEEFSLSPDADYYGVGAVFPTQSKMVANVPGLTLIQNIRKHTRQTLIGIGGINETNIEAVIRSGCDGVAVISAILGEEDVEKATRRLRNQIDRVKGES